MGRAKGGIRDPFQGVMGQTRGGRDISATWPPSPNTRIVVSLLAQDKIVILHQDGEAWLSGKLSCLEPQYEGKQVDLEVMVNPIMSVDDNQDFFSLVLGLSSWADLLAEDISSLDKEVMEKLRGNAFVVLTQSAQGQTLIRRWQGKL